MVVSVKITDMSETIYHERQVYIYKKIQLLYICIENIQLVIYIFI